MRIGIIEDDRLLYQALEIALREAGYETVSAHTKKEALTRFDGKEDLLLIDIGLPTGTASGCISRFAGKEKRSMEFSEGHDPGHLPDGKR